MQSITELMKEVEGWLDSFLQCEVNKDEWMEAGGMEHCLVAGKHRALAQWSVDGETLLPRMCLWNDGKAYNIIMKRTPCPDVVLYEWQCWDDEGIAEDIDFSCACRGKIIFP